MKNRRFILLFIAVLTTVAAIVDLPKKYNLKFALGSVQINREITSPAIDFSLGGVTIKRNFDTRLGLDLSGGTRLVLEADMAKIDAADRENAFVSAKNTVERRVNLFGLTEPVIQTAKTGNSYRIIAEIPGVSDVDRAIDLIGKTAQLVFREEASSSAQQATPSSILQMWPKSTGLSGKDLKKSQVVFDPQTGKPQVSLEFNSDGASMFAEITKRNTGKTLAVFLDDQLLSAPRVNEAITGGNAVISGDFTVSQAKEMAVLLNAGALPVPLKIIEQKNIGATLGKQTIDQSITAGVIGLSIIGVFMIFNYGLLGIIAVVALCIYTLVAFAIFKTIPITLTLAGIAGFILSIGMAVDANILIFERTREELHWGKDYLTAVKLGFARAFPSIRDSNISSLITCAILYWFGTGIVRGFAVTLAIGILVSLFSAITVTRVLLSLIYHSD